MMNKLHYLIEPHCVILFSFKLYSFLVILYKCSPNNFVLWRKTLFFHFHFQVTHHHHIRILFRRIHRNRIRLCRGKNGSKVKKEQLEFHLKQDKENEYKWSVYVRGAQLKFNVYGPKLTQIRDFFNRRNELKTKFWHAADQISSFCGPHLARGPYVVHAWSKLKINLILKRFVNKWRHILAHLYAKYLIPKAL